MNTERWLFEDNIDPAIHAKIQKMLHPLAQDLKAQCLFGARQTLAARPKEEAATSMRTLSRTDRDDIGLFCAVSLNRKGAAIAWFAFGSRAYAKQARAAAKKIMGSRQGGLNGIRAFRLNSRPPPAWDGRPKHMPLAGPPSSRTQRRVGSASPRNRVPRAPRGPPQAFCWLPRVRTAETTSAAKFGRPGGRIALFETLNGTDPLAFIMSSNEKRRHMTLGQRAMVAAKILFLKNKTQEELSKAVKIARPTIAKASTVLEYGKDLVDQVIDGTMPLSKAYDDALARKRKAI